ncbi:MAG TPA: DNA replication and repair protein RecF [Candidatus Dormibacteraeota bacterium]|nr:DNA replication and repair protein RecF [Candidatus Dormibacteraeota bacterium]
MRISQLRLLHFRIYQQATVDLLPGINLLLGENGSGKTSLLEAVATVALTRSPRTGALGECATFGASHMGISVTVQDGQRSSVLEYRSALQPEGNRWTRTLKEDGTPTVARRLLGRLGVVIFWPDDLSLIKGGPEPRRRMLDVVLSQLSPAYADAAVKYRRVVEQRNATLRRIRDGADAREILEQWDLALVRHGAVVIRHRREYLNRSQTTVAEAVRGIGEGGELGIQYRPGVRGELFEAGAEEAALSVALRQASREEVARGQSLVGPHRDDFEISLAGQPARQFASQGQQRSLVLALKVAEVRSHIETSGSRPVVMLDDVLSELDQRHRLGLIARLGTDLQVEQTLITATEDHGIGSEVEVAQVLQVESGVMRQLTTREEQRRKG